ncbi:MAG: site-specific integrase, partial [Bacteroidetes bacterium]|nr:site-specific integrase [Bacteroidota bacterium]
MPNLSTKYYLYIDDKSNNASYPIYLRLIYSRNKAEIYTGYSCNPKEWDQRQQMTKKQTSINRELVSLKNQAYDTFSELKRNNLPISAKIIKNLLTGKAKAEIGLLYYFDTHILEISQKAEIQDLSLEKYKQSLKSLKTFLEAKYKVSEYRLSQINYSFINAYDVFLKSTQQLHRNTANKYHTRLKTILRKAYAEGITTHQPYATFKLKSQKTNREFLTQSELDKLIALDLSTNESLSRVKDIFLFSVYTGIRFQDAQSLSIKSLFKEKKNYFIHFTQAKTGHTIDIPILEIAKSIIDKYSDSNERKILKKILPKISNQKVNAYLKVIADLAGIRAITHHIARHTFATTICLNNEMPIEELSKLLG